MGKAVLDKKRIRRPTYGAAQRAELREKIKKLKAALRANEADLRSITPKRFRSKLSKFQQDAAHISGV